jgi:CHAT domain-containing protein/Flp pilus assembly protein TadD
MSLLVVVTARSGGELKPEERRALAEEAKKLDAQAFALYRRGKLAEATTALKKGSTILRRLYPNGGHADLAINHNNLGLLLKAQGDLAGAEKHYREALTLYRQLSPKADHFNLAIYLNNLGGVLAVQGDLVGAEEYHREALAMRRRLHPKTDHPDLATSFNNLGIVLRERGDLAGAEELLREALAMRHRLFPQGHPRLSDNLTNLGLMLSARGDLAGAEKFQREALAMYRRLLPEADHPDLAACLTNLGSVLDRRGDLAGAERYYGEALAMFRRLFPKADQPHLATCLNNVGRLRQARGDYAGAERHFREALAMCRRLYPMDHPGLAHSLHYLGWLLWVKGAPAGAEKHLGEALAMSQRLLFRQAELAAEAEALDLAASGSPTRDLFLSVTRGRPGDLTAYDLVWQGRSALTRVLGQRHRDLIASHDVQARAVADRLLSSRQRLSHLLLSPVRDAQQHAQQVRKLTEAKEELERELSRQLRLERPPANPSPPPPRRLAEVLPTDAAFLDFYRYNHFEFDPKAKGIKGERHTPHYAAFMLGKDQAAVRVKLGEATPLEKAWADWHDAITRDAPAYRERRAAAALAKLVWDPIREKLPPGVRTLYLAPDGALTQVPFAALPGKKLDTVLLEEYAFATVPHGPFLLARLTEKGKALPAGGTFVAVGGVDYQKPPDRTPAVAVAGSPFLAVKRVAWGKLPATKVGMERVADLAEKHARLKARRLTGAGATTAAVLDELPQARYAHLATHGFFADDHFRSAFQVDPEQFQRLSPDRRGGARSPLVLSGLVFAGANRAGEDAKEDRGILTAEGLVGLRLDKLELAVLSACNTGLGEVGGGEGVYGLQRAFHIAGCKDVIASLWAVEDESTAALMTLFYSNLWRAKMTPLEALRQAQLHLYRHPQQVKSLARRDFDEVPLPRENPNPQGPRARTAQWAAFTFSGVTAPARAGD